MKEIWQYEKSPKSWRRGLIIKPAKKGNTKRCNNNNNEFICMTIQAHTVLQKLSLGIKITSRGNYVTLKTSKQPEIYFMDCILRIVIRRVHQFIDQTVFRLYIQNVFENFLIDSDI